jgi:hypothetical protein
MNVAAQIHEIAVKLPAPEQNLILALIQRLLPDYVATAEDLQDIATARDELANGQTVSFDEIDWS